MGEVALVAAERFVAAVAGQRDGDLGARRLADEVERQRRVVTVRLVVRFGQSRQRRLDVGFEDDLGVLGREAVRDCPGVGSLVVARLAEETYDGVRGFLSRLFKRHEPVFERAQLD